MSELPPLVDAAWVREHLGEPDLVLGDCRGPNAHQRGHLPASIPLVLGPRRALAPRGRLRRAQLPRVVARVVAPRRAARGAIAAGEASARRLPGRTDPQRRRLGSTRTWLLVIAAMSSPLHPCGAGEGGAHELSR